MSQPTTITTNNNHDDPIINSPFEEPTRHYRFGDAGITNEIDMALDVAGWMRFGAEYLTR
jgi:hypothetical protein